MQLRAKVCIPIAAITLAIGICCYFIIQKQFESLNETNIQNLVEAKASQMQQAIELCSEQAMRMAALMSRMPEVEAAYKKALEGDINDENSAASQQGREMLRKSLAPMLDGFTAVIGESRKSTITCPLHAALPACGEKNRPKRTTSGLIFQTTFRPFAPPCLT